MSAKLAAVYRRRLLKLAEFLDTSVPRRQFDIRKWAGSDWAGAPDLSCGTSACALGWATTIPSFRKLGLRLAWPRPRYDYSRPFVTIAGRRPRGAHSHPSYAAHVVFGVDRYDFDSLFMPGGYDQDTPTPKQVAKRIRQFVRERT